jgi:hypothetical protein
MSDKDERCKGCLAIDDVGDCSLDVPYYTENCPCMTCLVAVMCRENCDELILIIYRKDK